MHQEVASQLTDGSQDDSYSAQLEALFKDRENALQFPPELEKQFHDYYTKRFADHIRGALIVGGFMYFISAVIQLFFLPEIREVLLMRYTYIGPLILFFIVLAQPARLQAYHQAIAFCSATSLSLGLMCASFHMPLDSREMFGYGILLILIYGLCFSRMLFRPAVVFAIMNGVAINLLLYLEANTTVYVYLAENFIFVCACILLLTNNFIMEYSQRQEFLQTNMIEFEKSRTKNLNDHLSVIANQDPMTGLANIRQFETAFHDEWSRAIRHQYPIAILMIDFDKFKALNDTYGHQAGDEALQKVGRCLKTFARRTGDLAARYGGDEFIFLLSDTPSESAAELAESIRHAIEALQIPNINSSIKPVVTTTIGVAGIIPQRADTPELLLKMADESLFYAKEYGRNCVALENRICTKYIPPGTEDVPLNIPA